MKFNKSLDEYLPLADAFREVCGYDVSSSERTQAYKEGLMGVYLLTALIDGKRVTTCFEVLRYYRRVCELKR